MTLVGGGRGALLTEITGWGIRSPVPPQGLPPSQRHRFDVAAAPRRNESHMAGGTGRQIRDGRTGVGGVERWSHRSRGSVLGGPFSPPTRCPCGPDPPRRSPQVFIAAGGG